MTESIRSYLKEPISPRGKEMEGSGVSKCHIDSYASVYTWRTIDHGHICKYTDFPVLCDTAAEVKQTISVRIKALKMSLLVL